MTAHVPRAGAIAAAETGMRVVDSNGEQVGTVTVVKTGDPSAVTSAGRRLSPSLVETFRDAPAGSAPDVAPRFTQQLLRTGYVRIDAKGFLAGDRYAGAEQIDSVDTDGVHLSVPRDQLVPSG